MDDNSAMSASLPSLPLPSSMDELEALIQRFYGQNSPEEYTQIDTCLKSVQKSPNGFVLADQLMHSSDTNVRFFGALTFTVKINRDGAALLEDQGEDLVNRLLFWLIRCVNGGDASIVIRKLCSALVSLFSQTNGEWTLCVRHAMLCLINGGLVDYAEAISRTNVREIAASLSQSQAVACLWFSIALTESGDAMSTSSKLHETLVKLLRNVPDMLDIVEQCLASYNHELTDHAAEAIKLLQLIWGTETALFEDGIATESRLFSLTVAVVSHLGPNELLPSISELISTTINRGHGNQIKQLVMEKVVADSFTPYQQQLQNGEFDDDNMVYGRLLLELGGVLIDDSDFEEKLEAHFNEILERLVALAGSDGYPVEEDTLALEVVIYWTSYADWIVELKSMPDVQDQPREQNWINMSSTYISRVLEALLKKLQLPPPDIFSTWDRPTQVEFRSLRRDFRDFSASAFLLLGSSMLDTLVNYLQQLWIDRNWQGTEITMQCLKGVIEAVIDTETGDAALNTLLASPMFAPNDSDIPINIQQASIDLVADCSPFLERQSHVPMGILQWLFQALRIKTLAFPAAKAVSAICDSCRTKLASNAAELIQRYCEIAVGKNQQPEVVERLASAVGAVFQAFWTETKNKPTRANAITAFDQLFNTTLQALLNSEQSTSTEAKDDQITAVQSLVNIAREFREASNEIVDIDTGEVDSKSPDSTTILWATPRREQLTNILGRILQKYPSDGDLMEAICLLIRAGTTENLDNPFKIDGMVLTCLVTNYLEVTERPSFLLDTIARWLRSSLAWKDGDTIVQSTAAVVISRRSEIARACFLQVSAFLQRVYHAADGPRNHADQICSTLEFISTLLTTSDIYLLMADQASLSLFAESCQISVQCFDHPEPTLKQAASMFWIRLLDVRLNHPEIDTVNEAISDITLRLLPALTKSLIYALSGSSARSDIDTLVAPFRRLITFPIPRRQQLVQSNNGPGFTIRSLLTDALSSPGFPSTKVADQDKKVFLEKILRLRGDSSGTGRVSKEWWVACRGTFS